MKLKIRDINHARILNEKFNDRGVVEFCGVPLVVEESGVSIEFGVTSWDFSFVEVSRVKWEGNGLPPVGTVCEARIDFQKAPPYTVITMAEAGINVTEYRPEFQKVTILYASQKYMITDSKGIECMAPTNCIEFRPIKTAEQMADEKRELAMRQMHQDILANGFALEADEIVEKLYDAGYRKQ